MPLKLILHVGLPKTGTTSIQSALIASRDDLAAGGIFVPRATGAEPGQHASILEEVVGSERWRSEYSMSHDSLSLKEVMRDVRSADEGQETLLLSSELFSLTPSHTEALVSAIQPDELEVVGFVRSPVAWLESARSQTIRSGNPWGVSLDFCGFSRSSKGLSQWRSLVRLFGFLRTSLPASKLSLAVLTEGASSLALFDQALGLSMPLRSVSPRNVRWSTCELRLLKAIASTSAAPVRPLPLHNLRSEAIRHRMSDFVCEPETRSCHDLISPEHSAAVTTQAEAIRCQLADVSDRIIGHQGPFTPATLEERRTFREPSLETWQKAGRVLIGALDDLVDRELAAQEARDFWYERRADRDDTP